MPEDPGRDRASVRVPWVAGRPKGSRSKSSVPKSRIGGALVDDGGGADDPFLFSVKGAAQKLGVSVNTLYTLINSGEMEHVRVGKRILISRAGLTNSATILRLTPVAGEFQLPQHPGVAPFNKVSSTDHRCPL